MLVRYSTQYVLWSALDFLYTFSSDSLQLKNNDMITPLGLYPFIIKNKSSITALLFAMVIRKSSVEIFCFVCSGQLHYK